MVNLHLAVTVTDDDHAQGPADAPFLLVQYGDYECPYTRRSLVEVEEQRAELGADLRWVFRNFPLVEIHPHALRAAEAAEAAGVQGRFWEMHATLFGHQEALEDPDLFRYAAELGLHIETFAAHLASGAHLDRIRDDVDGAGKAGWGRRPPSSRMASGMRVPTRLRRCCRPAKHNARHLSRVGALKPALSRRPQRAPRR